MQEFRRKSGKNTRSVNKAGRALLVFKLGLPEISEALVFFHTWFLWERKHVAFGGKSLFLGSIMPSTPDLNIDHVAKLARIELTPEEKADYAAQLGDVLKHIERLKEVDVSGVEPTAHAFPLNNVWQEDIAREGLPVEDALRNAPARRGNMVVVPKVVD